MNKRIILAFFAFACLSEVKATEIKGQTMFNQVATTSFPTESWADAADISWYNASASEFTIVSEQQLAGLSILVNQGNSFEGKTIKLGKSLDLSNKLWLPIGKHMVVFSGVFDGNGYTISNLLINREDFGFAGLFGAVKNAVLKNIEIKTAKIKVKENVGALVGLADSTTIESCSAEQVEVATPEVDNSNSTVGGLVGSILGTSSVKNSYAKGAVSGGAGVGGLIGSVWAKINIEKSFFSGTVHSAFAEAGGFIGVIPPAFFADIAVEIQNCYSVADVDGSMFVGGFIGSSSSLTVVKNSYSAGDVSGDTPVASFIGMSAQLELVNCFFDSTLSTLNIPVGTFQNSGANFPGISGKTTDEMKTEAMATQLNSTGTSTIWYYNPDNNSGYPGFVQATNTSIQEAKKSDVKVYPTLTSDQITVDTNEILKNFSIYDYNGQLVKTGELNGYNVYVDELPKGNYILKITTDKGVSYTKIVKK